VPRNDKGGVYVSDGDIEAAVKWLSRGKDAVTLKDLRERLLPFYPEMPVAELNFLLGDAKSMSTADVRKLLADNTITNFDPVGEAFDVFDITGEGAADLDFLSAVFRQLGFERLSAEDMAVVMKTADVDHDGVISRDAFRHMLARANKFQPPKRAPSPPPSPTPSPRAAAATAAAAPAEGAPAPATAAAVAAVAAATGRAPGGMSRPPTATRPPSAVS